MKESDHRAGASSAAANLFVFREHDTIGNADAELDDKYLKPCFVDKRDDAHHKPGDLAILRDPGDHRGIVLGRTGAGKTALLRTLAECVEGRVVELNPDDLAIRHVSDSAVLAFFESAGVNMDLVYRALWRHVVVMELLKRRFKVQSDADLANIWRAVYNCLPGRQLYREAFDYMSKYGTHFWRTTEEQIKEYTLTIETELTAKTNVTLAQFLSLGADGTRRLTEEQRREVHQIGREATNSVQMGKLSQLFGALNDVFLTDKEKPCYILVDHLDKDWVDDPTRYRLIRALIETMRDLNSKVRFAKLCIAMRTDLLDRVFAATTDAGFQDDKYRALCLNITWTQPQLERVLERRVHELVRHRYTERAVRVYDLIPETIGRPKIATMRYMLERTLMRPRDIIEFFNACMESAVDCPRISESRMKVAERRYSSGRLTALANEWSVQHPCLRLFCVCLLAKRSEYFELGDITDEELLNLCAEVPELDQGSVTSLRRLAALDFARLRAFADLKLSSSQLRAYIAWVLYRAGAIGIKLRSRPYSWSYLGQDSLTERDIGDDVQVRVHPMLWEALSIRADQREAGEA